MACVNGYITVYAPNHPRSWGNGMIYEHTLVAEQKLHRPLSAQEVVHHIDYDRSNNDPSNLLVFATEQEHTRFHNTGEYYLDEEGVAHSPQLEDKFCARCGKQITTRKGLYCVNCLNIEKRLVKNRPLREELKQLIRNNSFVQIGRMYGVSDQAIRNWCRLVNLPTKKREIKQYTDQEWEKI